MHPSLHDLVALYDLQPHPEGGYYKETYRANGTIPALHLPEHRGERHYSTAMLFLIPEGEKSHIHRLKADEVWHFYLGGSLTLVQIAPDGTIYEVVLGQDVKAGQKVQHVVPAGHWFGAYPQPGSAYSFVGCTVAPGFDFADFEMGNRNNLLNQFPHAKEVMERLTD